ncbi:MAG: alpha/beta hydrolase [Kofleriaceae bacterium]|nr:alpha/beta hydrolase [Kofleriaceae bacterium]
MASPLHVVRAGSGPTVVLVHGSAADHSTWSIQLASTLTAVARLVAYDRRGSGRSPPWPVTAPWWSVEAHAADLAELLADEATPAVVVGSSFGAVVALELARRQPALCRAVVLCEPPMAAGDEVPVGPVGFLDELDAVAAADGAPAAATVFLRTVLGDDAFARMPRAYRDRSTAMWPAIRSDCQALAAYQPRYRQLAGLVVPTWLVGGERSAPYFAATLDALGAAIPGSERATIRAAGHMMHAEGHRQFGELLRVILGGPGPGAEPAA